ncbi:MAG: hypothetical protein HOW71_15310, partial [Nonomuraea sp.]|nr:hypothetical protein [Nonomuraea sp.]
MALGEAAATAWPVAGARRSAADRGPYQGRDRPWAFVGGLPGGPYDRRMALPKIATIVLTLALTAGGGGGDAVTARTPAEAVTQRLKGSAGVKVSRLVRLEYGEKVSTPPAQDDFVVPVDIGEYSESRTTGVLGATASDLTATYYRTNVPDEVKGVVPTDLSFMTTRTITIAGSG